MLFHILIATLLISLLSLVGILISYKKIKKFLHYFISFAAGTLLAVAFFDLIPHALHELEEFGVHAHEALVFVVGGIVLFFLVEKFIHWHHCGKEDCHDKPAGVLILAGDFVHNFIDGLLIAGAFMLNVTTGIVTTITVALHEIPQEFGDFAVLLHSGFKKKKALLLNLYSALSAVLGGILGYFFLDKFAGVTPYVVLVAAGGFLYIALTDIMPSLHKHKYKSQMVKESLIFLITIVGFYFLLAALH